MTFARAGRPVRLLLRCAHRPRLDPMDMQGTRLLPLPELKAELQRLGLPTAGLNEGELAGRLRAAQEQTAAAAAAEPRSAATVADRIALEATNSAVTVAPKTHRYTILRRQSDGKHLSCCGGGGLLQCVSHVDDSAVWDAAPDGFRHPVSGTFVAAESHDQHSGTVRLQLPGESGGGATATAAANFTLDDWGPESLPSDYLATLERQGVVCMPALIAPGLVAELRALAAAQVAREDSTSRPLSSSSASGGAEEEPPLPLVLQSEHCIQCCVNPVALWVIREYMKTDNVYFAHSQGFATLRPGAGTGAVHNPGNPAGEGVGGWHSDWPYSPGNLHSYLDGFGSYPTE